MNIMIIVLSHVLLLCCLRSLHDFSNLPTFCSLHFASSTPLPAVVLKTGLIYIYLPTIYTVNREI